ncbi:hypothetical protein GCM10010358_73030 [Streptomyces minutiscleroticus]|uniref:Uncharacterized protein n=1 Tax=Streptomyces minutiscleroticus TaxID=68238 RepID=A0A918U8N6_9ACTN|nr:hypothetical protein [Streptomyces minutiscleroticus]GGY09769.1 hypothetical protein GCM10010358_73030 [Streptomyces minutiscleroticus]
MLLVGALLIASAVTAVVGIVVVLILLSHPPLPLSRLYALVALVLVSLAAAVYCYGWFSVTMEGPFPELCKSHNDVGAELTAIKQQYWPLRSACLYSDGSTVEYVSMAITVLVCLSASFGFVSAGISVYLRKRLRQPSGATS